MAFFSKWRLRRNRPGVPRPPEFAGPLKPPVKKTIPSQSSHCPSTPSDSIKLTLPMLTISVTRKLTTPVPHEVSVIVPRAEIRFTDREAELIYSSITVVSTPVHSMAREQSPEGEKCTKSLADITTSMSTCHQPADTRIMTAPARETVKITFR